MKRRLLARETAEVYADWFRALSDGTRVQLLALLASEGRPMSVGELTERLPVGQSTVSHHLAALEAVGFVRVHRHQCSSLYRVNPACVECFPTAADVVMGRRPPDPAAVSCGEQDKRTDVRAL
ncbi:MAG: ArsR/SmtB family transcription factor [Acidimicrobiales bacterium]